MRKKALSKFTSEIIEWYKENKRDLPWRSSSSVYKVWLSEVILQQTRVAQGLPYYEKFVRKYPDVFKLAAASEEEVLKLWQGLGYYSRARNLHSSAKYVVDQYSGEFPDSYKKLLELKGVGDYTASAIASICYQEPKAVVDGNVFRVLARYFGIAVPINTTEGKKVFKAKAEEVLDRENPGTYNQGIMEFGALQCTPHNPGCTICPLKNECQAFQYDRIEELPVKNKKLKVRERHLNYLVFTNSTDHTYIQKRRGKGIWQNLYEFPLVETKKHTDKEGIMQALSLKGIEVMEPQIERFYPKPIKHLLSHQRLWVEFWIIDMDTLPELSPKLNRQREIIEWLTIDNYPVPKVIHNFLDAFKLKA